jgi:hypothetical protein
MSDTAHDSPRHELYDPDPPPTSDEVQAAQEESRDLLEQSEMAAGRLEHEHVGRIATRAARKESRRYGLWGVLFAALVSLAVSLVAVSVAAKASTTAEQATESAQAARHTIDDALAELAAANKQLQERGQAPVQVAPNPDPSDAIQAAVLAKVLAQLPATPTAQQVAAVLQPAVAAQVTGPSRDTLAQLVSSYFADNPTTPQIQAAVDSFLTQHPPKDGNDGRDGDKGEKGDSPPCLEEASQCRGQNGTDSTVAGPPGPPVNSWTWPDPVVPAVTHTCTRSGGDDSAANYTCT